MSRSMKQGAPWTSVDRLVIACALVLAALGCDDDSNPPPDAAAAGGGRDGATAAPAPADGGMDAAVKAHPMTPKVKDAGTRERDAGRDAALDAGSLDAGPMCDPARCPVTSAVLDDGYRQLEQKPCCVQYNPDDYTRRNDYVGTCGFIVPAGYAYRYDDYCEPLLDGELDESCLDTVVNGERIEGCRRPDGECGHLTPGWGCHQLFRWNWRVSGDEVAKYPNPFLCTEDEQPCTRSDQCCDAQNYGSWCYLPDSLAQPADADVPVGLCLDTFRSADFNGRVLPPYPGMPPYP